VSDLLDCLRDLRTLAELGEEVDTEELQSMLAVLRATGESRTRAELEAIQAELKALEAVTAVQRDAVGQRLAELAKSREGIDGYNHLKAFHTAQRLSKRA
jgi:uncharacterized protein HemX